MIISLTLEGVDLHVGYCVIQPYEPPTRHSPEVPLEIQTDCVFLEDSDVDISSLIDSTKLLEAVYAVIHCS